MKINTRKNMLIAALALIGFTQSLSAGTVSPAKKDGATTETAEERKSVITMPATKSSGSSEGGSGYSTGIGLRGGWTSGLSIKHFIKSNAAIEGILGSRWHGISLTALYELHKANALGASGLSWEYGGGLRFGSYSGRYYRSYDDNRYYDDRNYTAISLVGVFGLEYHFTEIPFTLGFDLMPYFDIVGRGDSYLDGSLSFRYAF